MQKSMIFMTAVSFFLRGFGSASANESAFLSDSASPGHPAPSSTLTDPRLYPSTNIVQHMELSDTLAVPGQVILRP